MPKYQNYEHEALKDIAEAAMVPLGIRPRPDRYRNRIIDLD